MNALPVGSNDGINKIKNIWRRLTGNPAETPKETTTASSSADQVALSSQGEQNQPKIEVSWQVRAKQEWEGLRGKTEQSFSVSLKWVGEVTTGIDSAINSSIKKVTEWLDKYLTPVARSVAELNQSKEELNAAQMRYDKALASGNVDDIAAAKKDLEIADALCKAKMEAALKLVDRLEGELPKNCPQEIRDRIAEIRQGILDAYNDPNPAKAARKMNGLLEKVKELAVALAKNGLKADIPVALTDALTNDMEIIGKRIEVRILDENGIFKDPTRTDKEKDEAAQRMRELEQTAKVNEQNIETAQAIIEGQRNNVADIKVIENAELSVLEARRQTSSTYAAVLKVAVTNKQYFTKDDINVFALNLTSSLQKETALITTLAEQNALSQKAAETERSAFAERTFLYLTLEQLGDVIDHIDIERAQNTLKEILGEASQEIAALVKKTQARREERRKITEKTHENTANAKKAEYNFYISNARLGSNPTVSEILDYLKARSDKDLTAWLAKHPLV